MQVPANLSLRNDKFTLLRRQAAAVFGHDLGLRKRRRGPLEKLPRHVALSAHAEAGTLSVRTDKLSEIRTPKAAISRVWGDEGDLIPESAVESIIGELQDLFARHGAGAALSAKAVFKPTKDFHTARHTLFSAEQNLEIDKVVPVSASVKTKLGRGGSYGD